jgi:hypothetical protein
MPQINSGKSPPWVSGEIVTATGLNQMIDAATLDPSVITSQSNLTTLTNDEYAFVVDTTGALKKTQLKNIFDTGSDIITDNIDGLTNNGTLEVGATGTTGHLALRGGNGGTSGLVSIYAKDVDINAVGLSSNGSFDVTAGTGGMSFNAGLQTIDFQSPIQVGEVKGTANFTGALQVNGTVGYVLSEVYEETPALFTATYAGFYDSAFTSSVFTKPSSEIWIFEVYFRHQGKQGYSYDFAGRYGSQAYRTGAYIFDNKFFDSQGGGSYYYGYYTARWVVPTGVGMVSETFKLDAFAAAGSELSLFSTTGPYTTIITGGSLPPSKFRIYKYKTA